MVMKVTRQAHIPGGEMDIIAAINDVTAAAAIYAKANHPTWQNRTGTLEGSIRFVPSRKIGVNRYLGAFGSFDVHYAIFLEIGTRFIQAGHYLRNAADREFPTLGARMAARSSNAS